MARSAFPITSFTNAEGDPLSFGYITVRLNTDARSDTNEQIVAGKSARIELDTNGAIVGSPSFWPTEELTPDTVYLLSTFTNAGQGVLYDSPIIV